MKRYRKWIYIFLVSLLLIAGGCSSNSSTESGVTVNGSKDGDKNDGKPKHGGSLSIAYDSDISNYDPILGNSGNDHSLLYPVYDTLVSYNSELEPIPNLAESWETPNEKTILLHLREGVTFHDGTAFNAEAVKYNLDRVRSEDSNISDLSSVDSVEVIDDNTVQLNLNRPDSSIILALSDRSGMVVSPAAVEKHGEDFAQNPVGAGPFKMVKWVRNGEIQFEAFKDYWQDGLPYLDKITVKIMPDENTRLNSLKSGQVQFYWNVSPDNSQVLKNDQSLALDTKMKLAFYNIYLNTTMAPFDKKEVRQALQYAINREALVKALTFDEGEAAYQTFPKDYWAASSEITIPYDAEKSKSLLKEAGEERVSFDMFVPSTPFYQRLAEAIKGQVKEAGFDLNIEPMELTKGVALYFNEKQIPSNLTSWTGRPDPHQTVQLLLSGNGFYNAGSETSDEREELIAKAASAYEHADRARIYEEINKLTILDDSMIVPIMFVPSTGAMALNVKGFEGTLLGKPKFSFLWLDDN
ncbi:ABC transporter substrate-binding protein [Cytobacillus purgationiresistens]|uniref:ABC-type transport system substrate-binding protein n=1 Tax=Cytobacillus purgationiresistens TaxID=863449 RepID=A0ABU0APH2_9BACI|nr:ABC transporter substrate-binding protein [Cytobacillus purgationiresistens]MDQ0272646.1 ABC-type transport system substrate-binding protein [Cytobacillus purgationiresistens]